MQLNAEGRREVNFVAGYSATEVRLRERTLTSSAIVTADRVVPWPVHSVEALTPAMLELALELKVDVLLLATGATQVWPSAEVLAHAATRRAGLEVMALGAAARTFNLLLSDERSVALAVILASRA